MGGRGGAEVEGEGREKVVVFQVRESKTVPTILKALVERGCGVRE